jgi:uncharacterized DUF497 family protein
VAPRPGVALAHAAPRPALNKQRVVHWNKVNVLHLSVRVGWDAEKADQNVRKHRIAFEEAATVFGDPLALVINDPSHLENARIIGESEAQRILLVVFVERGSDGLRLVSARRATRHDRRRYEEGE